MDCLHLGRSDLDLAWSWSRATLGRCTHARRHLAATHAWWHSTSHTSTKVRVATHDHIHESHWILLDSLVDLRVVLLKTSHELLVKLRVLSHALSHVGELWVLHQSHQFCSRGHATTSTTWLAHAWVLVTIVCVTRIATCRDVVQIDTFE